VRLDAQDQVVPHRSSPHEEKKAVAEVLSFDDGAQYFTARAPEFRAFVEECVARGCVREWAPLRVAVIDREGEVVLKPDEGKKKEEKEAENNARYVGSPTMHAFIPFLAQPVAHTIQQSVRVADIQVRWCVCGGGACAFFCIVVLKFDSRDERVVMAESAGAWWERRARIWATSRRWWWASPPRRPSTSSARLQTSAPRPPPFT
jgi:hypothetical protein